MANITNWLSNTYGVNLFADAESTEYVAKYLICSNFANNITKMENTLSKILLDEVSVELGLQSLLHTLDGFQRMGKGLVVAGIADDDVTRLQIG